MENEILNAINEYKKRHPEVDEIMKSFQMSQEIYDKVLASFSTKQQATPTFTLTTGGRYNINVSKSN